MGLGIIWLQWCCNVVTDELWPSWQQHLCSDSRVLTIDVQTDAALNNLLTQASVQRAAAVRCVMNLSWDTQFYTQQCMGVVCRGSFTIHSKYFLQRKPCSCRGLIGLKCPGSWWMEWGKKMCADSAIGCHQIPNQNTERDTIQWKHSAAPSSFKMGNLESTTTPLRLSCGGLRNGYLHSIANLFTPNTQPSKQHKLILFWEVETFLSHFSQ